VLIRALKVLYTENAHKDRVEHAYA
jgi:hypothetical protein